MGTSSFFHIAVSLALLSISSGCGHDHSPGAKPYDTLQQCFDDHHNHESLPTDQSIVICCLDHPIGGVWVPCGETLAACEAFVGTNLNDTIGPADLTAGCTDYIAQKVM